MSRIYFCMWIAIFRRHMSNNMVGSLIIIIVIYSWYLFTHHVSMDTLYIHAQLAYMDCVWPLIPIISLQFCYATTVYAYIIYRVASVFVRVKGWIKQLTFPEIINKLNTYNVCTHLHTLHAHVHTHAHTTHTYIVYAHTDTHTYT